MITSRLSLSLSLSLFLTLTHTQTQTGTFQCAPGYSLLNNISKITCNIADGTWPTHPSCEVNECIPTEVPFSNHKIANSVNGTTGQSVEITCDEGYTGDQTLSGNNTGGYAVCGTDGTFSTVTCRPNPCRAITVPYSTDYSPQSDYEIEGHTGDVVNVTCDDFSEGGGETICQPDGTFSHVECMYT